MSSNVNLTYGTSKIEVKSNYFKGLKITDLKDEKSKSIFTNVFDTDKNNELSEEEIQKAIEKITTAAGSDDDKTNLSDNEALGFINTFETLKNKIQASDLFKFFTDAKAVFDSKEEKTEENDPKNWTSYTVQNGQHYKKLIIESLKGQGIENPTEEQIAEAQREFEEKNPKAVKTSPQGVKYLLAGATIQIKGGLIDKKNGAEQEQAWLETIRAKNRTQEKQQTQEIAEEGNATEETPNGEESQNIAEDNTSKGVEDNTQAQNTQQNKWTPKVGESSRYHGSANKITNVNEDGSFVEKNTDRSKIHVCNPDGSVRTVYTMGSNGRLKSTVYKNGKAYQTYNYPDGTSVNDDGTATKGPIYRRNHYNGSDDTWKDTQDGFIQIRKFDNGKVEYTKFDNEGNCLGECDENGTLKQAQQ